MVYKFCIFGQKDMFERFSSDWELRYVNIVVAIYDVGYHCVGK